MATRKRPAPKPKSLAPRKAAPPGRNKNGREPVAGEGRGKGGGPPELEIDESKMETYALYRCTNKEIATMLGVSVDTLERRYADKLEKFRAERRFRIRRGLTRVAWAGDVKALIHLDKTELGAVERVEMTGANGTPLMPEPISEAERVARAAALLDRARKRMAEAEEAQEAEAVGGAA